MPLSIFVIERGLVQKVAETGNSRKASPLATLHQTDHNQVWAYFGFDVAGNRLSWHLWRPDNSRWVHIDAGPLLSPASLFRSTLTDEEIRRYIPLR